ncbi:unnamed protein product [Victoria cruziana]
MVEMSDLVTRRKPKRLRSLVWNDFKKIKKNGKDLAMCKNCSKEFVGGGTTHLRKHLLRCVRKPSSDVVNQSVAIIDNNKEDTPPLVTPEPPKLLNSIKFVQEQSQFDLARMIILHDYPFSLVEHVGFRIFVNNLQPQFKMVSPNTVKADCLTIFEQEKEKLYEVLDKLPGRVSLTANMWTSYQNVSYLCLTAQYVDESWALQKKILNFVTVESPYTGEALSEIIMTCLMDWNIYHKLFAITMENSSMNDTIVSRIRGLLTEKRMVVGSGLFFHVQCATHCLSLIAQDGLELINEVVHKIRESVKLVKSSQAREQKFNEVASQVRVNSQRSMCLDIPAQWNTTYLMMEVALEYKEAFSYMQKQDPSYNMAPTDREWEVASLISNHLKLLYEVAKDFLGTKYPTSNLYFPALCAMKLQLNEWSKSINSFVGSMAAKMKENFDKYWKFSNMLLAIAVILDPRFKMKLVEYYYQRIYGNSAAERIKEVYDSVTNLYHEYAGHSASNLSFQEYGSQVGSVQGNESNGNLLPDIPNDIRDNLRGFDEFLNATTETQRTKSDLDLYLEEGVSPRNHEFNILSWWRINSPKYPVLSRMARDILGIPVSTVAFESTFNTRGRVLDAYKSSLDSQTVQALICAQDWLLDEFDGSALSMEPT